MAVAVLLGLGIGPVAAWPNSTAPRDPNTPVDYRDGNAFVLTGGNTAGHNILWYPGRDSIKVSQTWACVNGDYADDGAHFDIVYYDTEAEAEAAYHAGSNLVCGIIAAR